MDLTYICFNCLSNKHINYFVIKTFFKSTSFYNEKKRSNLPYNYLKRITYRTKPNKKHKAEEWF